MTDQNQNSETRKGEKQVPLVVRLARLFGLLALIGSFSSMLFPAGGASVLSSASSGCLLFAPFALVCGIIAMMKIHNGRKNGISYGGMGFAIFAIIAGIGGPLLLFTLRSLVGA